MNEYAQNTLAILLDFESQIRNLKSLSELQYFVVNETYKLAKYRQAILFDARAKVCAMSGVALIERNAPFVQWLNTKCKAAIGTVDQPETHAITDIDAAGMDWLPSQVLMLPLIAPNGQRYATLLIAKETQWHKGEIDLLNHLVKAYAYAWSHHSPKPKSNVSRKVPKNIKVAAGALFVLALFFPVKLTVLAQAEITARDPIVIRAPMTGIVEHIAVKPNQQVDKGDVLVKLDQSDIINRRHVAIKTLQSLNAQYRQTKRLALTDSTGRQELASLSGKAKEQKAQIEHFDQLLERSVLVAPDQSTVVIDNVKDWIGKPVQVGERIMFLAKENALGVEAWLAVSDAIKLEAGSDVMVFLNTSPLTPISATLKYVSYEAQLRPDGVLAHRILATLKPTKDLPRLGARGTARIEGESVTFLYWVFRRPLAVIRQFLGA